MAFSSNKNLVLETNNVSERRSESGSITSPNPEGYFANVTIPNSEKESMYKRKKSAAVMSFALRLINASTPDITSEPYPSNVTEKSKMQLSPVIFPSLSRLYNAGSSD